MKIEVLLNGKSLGEWDEHTPVKTATVEMDSVEVALTEVNGIEIANVGEEWPAATGPFTLTTEHIASVVASQEDPAIKSPRVKLGHDSFLTPDHPGSVFGGKPVFGKFVNLRTTNNGNTLVGDIAGIPKWAADVLPYAWPSRSGEWLEDWDNFGTAKTQWPMVLSAVALLGVELPGITTIEDLPALFTAEGPDGVKVVVDGAKIKASRKENMPPIVTSVESSDVRSSFFEDFAPWGGDRQWWWPSQVFINPTAVIAEDEETSELYFVPYTAKEDSVEWGEPISIKHQYVDKEKGTVLAGATPALVFSTAAAARPADRQKTNDKQKEKQSMNIDIPALRSRLGLSEDQLPDDATEEQINAAFAIEPPEPDDTDDDETEDDDDTTDEVEVDEEDPNIVKVSRKVFDGMQSKLTKLEKSDATRTAAETKARRDGIVDNAIHTGRIMPSERDFYRELLDVNEDKTSKKLSSLTAGKVPVGERGENPSTETADTQQGTGLFPELRREEATT